MARPAGRMEQGIQIELGIVVDCWWTVEGSCRCLLVIIAGQLENKK